MTNRRDFLHYAAAICTLSSGPFGSVRAQKRALTVSRIAHSDLKASRIAYGTGFLEFSWDKDPDFVKKAMAAINVAYDNGVTLFDLADVYGHGKSEIALGN